MDRNEVIKLILVIRKSYPQFDTSDPEIDRHLKYLKDFSFAAAAANVDHHIKTSQFPPKIAEIRGRLGEQKDKQHAQKLTYQYFDNLDKWAEKAAPPPKNLRGQIHDWLQ